MKGFALVKALIGLIALAVALAACSAGNVFSLDVGTCFDDVEEFSEEGSGEVADVPIVECSEPHDNQVFAKFDLPDGDFPGQAGVQASAEDGCIERFEDFVGLAYADSRYVASSLTPTDQTWGDGDREVVCFLYDIDLQKLEGTAEGTAE